jgi:tRNA (cmo5U34)-methyltransferase
MGTDALFDDYVDNYDEQRRKIIPGFERFYETLLDRIKTGSKEPNRVIDLGAGTGLATKLLTNHYPESQVRLVDASEEMLAEARNTLDGESFNFVVQDLETIELEEKSWDAAISALVLHYLPDDKKIRLLEQVYRGLVPGGTFAFGTVVAGPDESIQSIYDSIWKEKAREAGGDEDALQEAVERQDAHHQATVQNHLEWLRKSGFESVDCWFKYYGIAVFSGTKPTNPENSRKI